jgi:hypothetical protein
VTLLYNPSKPEEREGREKAKVEESINYLMFWEGGTDCPSWKVPSQCPFVLQVKVQYCGDRVKRWEMKNVKH